MGRAGLQEIKGRQAVSPQLAQSINGVAPPEFKVMGAAGVTRRAPRRKMNLGEQRVGSRDPAAFFQGRPGEIGV